MDFSGFDESYFPGDIENDIADFIEDDSVYTENTSENTSKNEQREREESSHSFISVKEKKPFPSEFELTPEMLHGRKQSVLTLILRTRLISFEFIITANFQMTGWGLGNAGF
jgi:hypothetical protein